MAEVQALVLCPMHLPKRAFPSGQRQPQLGPPQLLGPLHEESYILTHAIDGDSYGYGGRTQNGRWAAAHPGLSNTRTTGNARKLGFYTGCEEFCIIVLAQKVPFE